MWPDVTTCDARAVRGNTPPVVAITFLVSNLVSSAPRGLLKAVIVTLAPQIFAPVLSITKPVMAPVGTCLKTMPGMARFRTAFLLYGSPIGTVTGTRSYLINTLNGLSS